MTSGSQTIDWIEKSKGFAILGVIAVHTIQHFTLSKGLTEFAGSGMYCVSLFLIISAYLTFNSFERKKNVWTVKTYLKYLGHKITRLVPVLYLALLWNIINYSIAIGHVPYIYDDIWRKVLFSGLFINGFTYRYFSVWATWYIGILVIFYIIAPFLYQFINTAKKAVILFTIATLFGWGLNGILIQYLNVSKDDWFFYGWFPHQFPLFTLGIVLFYFIQAKSLVDIKQPLMVFLFAVATGFLLSLCTTISPFEIHIQYGILLLLISIILFSQRWQWLDWLKPLGKYSYGIYLLHICLLKPVSVAIYRLHICETSIWAFSICYILIVMLSLLVAKVVNKYFEKPFFYFTVNKLGL